MLRELRHGLKVLWPSEIADQFYCEYKVHLTRLHPEVQVESASLDFGEDSHAALANQAKPATETEIEQSIQAGKKLAVAEWQFDGTVQGVHIRGRPDLVAFDERKVTLILDFKFSAARRPYPSHQVQAEVYALLAENTGFSVEDLVLGVVLLPAVSLRRTLNPAISAKGLMLQQLNVSGTLAAIHQACAQERRTMLECAARQSVLPIKEATAFLFRFDKNAAVGHLGRALQYWLSERDPEPERVNPRKCAVCAQNAVGLCEHALRKPDPGYVVRRTPDGQVFVSRH